MDKKDLQFQKRKFSAVHALYSEDHGSHPLSVPRHRMKGGDSTERGWFQRRPLEGRPS